jgi:hypothetical protein
LNIKCLIYASFCVVSCPRSRLGIAGARLAENIQQPIGDDRRITMDLRSTFPDSLDSRIPPEPLDGEILHHAHAAEDLDRMVGDPADHFGALDVDHRRLVSGQRALIHLPGGLHRQQPGHPDVGRHVGGLEPRVFMPTAICEASELWTEVW